MRFGQVLTASAVLGAAGVPANAQLVEAGPAPSRAETRTYAWNEAFPVTPPFAEWTQLLEPSRTQTRFWLHADSLSWRSDRWLLVDSLLYGAPAEGEPMRYFRVRYALSCDQAGLSQTVAGAEVVIDPDGNIRPLGPVTEREGVGYHADGTRTLFPVLCFDEAVRARFMAE